MSAKARATKITKEANGTYTFVVDLGPGPNASGASAHASPAA